LSLSLLENKFITNQQKKNDQIVP